jgi:hypothetical protein
MTLQFKAVIGLIALIAFLMPGASYAQTPATLSANELDDLVAPIALYPDPLLSQVLAASTYPLEIVKAAQWLQRNPNLQGSALVEAAAQQNWDPSVQALVMFPSVLEQLSQDITWTTDLGNAFLNQDVDVMNAVQRVRLKAQQLGYLASTPQQTVSTIVESGQNVVAIVPASPELIYIPFYDPAWIWGPAIYHPYPGWPYPRRSGVALIIFGPAIRISVFIGPAWGRWGSWGWYPVWRTRAVIVNVNFIRRYHFNDRHFAGITAQCIWTHDPNHRHSIPYPNRILTDRYREGAHVNARPAPMQPRPAPPTTERSKQPAQPGARSTQPPERSRQPDARSTRPAERPSAERGRRGKQPERGESKPSTPPSKNRGGTKRH